MSKIVIMPNLPMYSSKFLQIFLRNGEPISTTIYMALGGPCLPVDVFLTFDFILYRKLFGHVRYD